MFRRDPAATIESWLRPCQIWWNRARGCRRMSACHPLCAAL